MFVYYNPNPTGARVGDCAIRACSAALEQPWDKTYLDLCIEGLLKSDLPSANAVWGAYLRRHGFMRRNVDVDNANTYTLSAFSQDHPNGVFVVALSGHVVTMINGDWMDSWDSGSEVVLYYFKRGDSIDVRE